MLIILLAIVLIIAISETRKLLCGLYLKEVEHKTKFAKDIFDTFSLKNKSIYKFY